MLLIELQLMDYDYPLFQNLENKLQLLDQFKKLNSAPYHSLEELFQKAALPDKNSIDSFAYAGYFHQPYKDTEKIIRVFVALDNERLFVYGIPVDESSSSDIWKPKLSHSDSFKKDIPLLGLQGFAKENKSSFTVEYENENVVEQYCSHDSDPNFLIGKVYGNSLGYMLLAKSRPIKQSVTERSKRILNS